MSLKIRLFLRDDLDHLFELLSDEEVMRYLEPVYSREKTKAFLEKAGLGEEPLIYAVEKENDFIGYLIYHDYDERSKEIGWVLKKDVWGKGYAQELTEQLVAQAMQEQKDVVIECAPEQEITKKIAIRNGFRYCGREDGLDIYRLSQKMTDTK